MKIWYYNFIHVLFIVLAATWIATIWYVYDLRKEINFLQVEKAEVEETLSDWKHSNQMMAGQLKDKHEYIGELLQRLRQFQDEIEIVKLREDK